MSGVTVGLFGEVQPNRKSPELAFKHLQPLIDSVDVRICQLEASLSNAGHHTLAVSYPGHQADPENVNALVEAQIDIVTFASNTSMEFGADAMLETVDLLEDHGIKVAGAGKDLESAKEPVYHDHNGTTIAVVDACSPLNVGQRATQDSPGVFALEGESYAVEPDVAPGNECTGMPHTLKSVADHNDLQQVKNAIAEADAQADHVIAAFHWGVPWIPDITYFQTDVAYEAIEQGADAVVGTHPHVIQPVDMHQGRPIFYSMANCVFDDPHLTTDDYESSFVNYYGMEADTSVDKYNAPVHTRDGIFAKLAFNSSAPEVEIRPIHITEDADPILASLDDQDGERIYAVLAALSEDIGVTIGKRDGAIVIEDANDDARQEIRKRVLSFPWTYKLREEVFLDNDFSFADWY